MCCGASSSVPVGFYIEHKLLLQYISHSYELTVRLLHQYFVLICTHFSLKKTLVIIKADQFLV